MKIEYNYHTQPSHFGRSKQRARFQSQEKSPDVCNDVAFEKKFRMRKYNLFIILVILTVCGCSRLKLLESFFPEKL